MKKHNENHQFHCPPIGSFDRTIIDSLSAHIAILDKDGMILETNRAWREFGETNGIGKGAGEPFFNYLHVCEKACTNGCPDAERAARGIRSVMTGRFKEFTMEYLCQTPEGSRSFIMKAGKVSGQTPFSVVVSHEDITPLKKAEKTILERERALEEKSRNLSEANTALKVLLDQRSRDRQALEERIMMNIRQLVMGYLKKLSESHLDGYQKTLLGIIESHLNDVVSPFLQNISGLRLLLTPGEIQVAALVKDGLSTKEIADILHVSTYTVDFHRKNIRKKLGLNRRDKNLRSHLMQLDMPDSEFGAKNELL